MRITLNMECICDITKKEQILRIPGSYIVRLVREANLGLVPTSILSNNRFRGKERVIFFLRPKNWQSYKIYCQIINNKIVVKEIEEGGRGGHGIILQENEAKEIFDIINSKEFPVFAFLLERSRQINEDYMPIWLDINNDSPQNFYGYEIGR